MPLILQDQAISQATTHCYGLRLLWMTLLLFACLLLSPVRICSADTPEVLPQRQIPWTVSNVQGTPDPPLPYKATRVFPHVQLDRPTDVSWCATAGKWIATQTGGQLVAFENDPENATTEPFVNMSDAANERVYNAFAVLFHPDLENEPWCFVTYLSKQKDPKGVHLGRFRVTDPTIPTVDPDSLEVLTSWSSSGHMGSSIRFGPDGMLYLAIGDGQPAYPPDPLNVGQDRSNIQSTILRIDVSQPSADRPYRVPPDNPFLGDPDIQEEIWAYGFRNPWKIAFDPNTGDLLAADVGWEMREMIYRVRRGANYGWSIMEGSQSVKPDVQPDVSISPPIFEHTHVDSRSISGGHFWQSDRIAELKGAYIYGDWMTGKVWALKHDGDRVLWQKELVDTPLRVISFMLDPTGEVLILGYDGTIWRLDPNTQVANQAEFPRRLSDTGLFSDVVNQQPAPGVEEYEISAHHWADETDSRQWIAVPGSQQLGLFQRDDWKTGDTAGRFDFPRGTVLAKTVRYLPDPDQPSSRRRLETQLLHRLNDDWRAYNYVWNDEQTDAVLQDDIATQRKLVVKDPTAPGGSRSQTWRHSSRSECLLCHIWAAGVAHAFWPEQLNIGYQNENQLARFARLGLFKQSIPANSPIASPTDTSRTLQERARSYLALNCSTCHRPQGGGSANFNFDLTKSLQENNYLDALPAQGSFGIKDARVVAPGDPFRSVLLYRTLKSGRGHMPQFGSNVIDLKGVRLLHDWISSMPPSVNASEPLQQRIHSLMTEDHPEQVIDSLLASTSGATALSLACSDELDNSELRNLIVRLGNAHQEPQIRDLFEHYLPESQRVKRLGPTINADALLAIAGSSERGRQLFEQSKEINCRQCHRIGAVGKNVGPDLSSLGIQRTTREILASILDPSDKIEPKYRARQ
ncbi:MAG: hypothetical protein HKN47_22750, partial [Pirellulaceae bacterium]|nr:hypothetical protein [Pirellulaceae bacterium]